MELELALTYKDLSFSFGKILHVDKLLITEEPNEHATMQITAVLDFDLEQTVFHEVPNKLKLLYNNGGGQKVMFSGMLLHSSMKRKGAYIYLTAEAVDFTYQMDVKKHIRSFQNTGEAVHSLMDAVTQAYPGCVNLKYVKNAPLGQIMMQYEETDWEFLRRLLTMFHARLYPSVLLEAPCFMSGFPSDDGDAKIRETFFTSGTDFFHYETIKANASGGVMQQQYLVCNAESYEILHLGTKLKYRGNSWLVGSVRREMREGLVVSTYKLVQPEMEILEVERSRMLPGISVDGKIKAVTRNKVQVIMGRDENKRTAGMYWFPYSTVAGSSGGSGWHCMPEVGEPIRVYFPTWNDKEAYVISSLSGQTRGNKSGGGMNPAVRHISTAQGNTVTMTGDGTTISSPGGSGSVSMSTSGDLVISAAVSLSMCAGSKISFSANEIEVTGTDKISMSSDGGASITMDPSLIDIFASKINQN